MLPLIIRLIPCYCWHICHIAIEVIFPIDHQLRIRVKVHLFNILFFARHFFGFFFGEDFWTRHLIQILIFLCVFLKEIKWFIRFLCFGVYLCNELLKILYFQFFFKFRLVDFSKFHVDLVFEGVNARFIGDVSILFFCFFTLFSYSELLFHLFLDEVFIWPHPAPSCVHINNIF